MKTLFATAALAGIICATPAAAVVTVGNPAVTASVIDTCQDCTFVLNEAFGVGGLSVSSFSFFSGLASDITPLLLTRADAGSLATFTVVGIGQTRQASLGANTFSFATAQGTNITTANSYFGFTYRNGGVVQFDYTAGSPTSGTFVAPNGFAATLGSSFTDDTSTQPQNAYSALNAREYSINATAVPEPLTWGMMVVGFAGMGYALRRNRKPAFSFS